MLHASLSGVLLVCNSVQSVITSASCSERSPEALRHLLQLRLVHEVQDGGDGAVLPMRPRGAGRVHHTHLDQLLRANCRCKNALQMQAVSTAPCTLRCTYTQARLRLPAMAGTVDLNVALASMRYRTPSPMQQRTVVALT